MPGTGCARRRGNSGAPSLPLAHLSHPLPRVRGRVGRGLSPHAPSKRRPLFHSPQHPPSPYGYGGQERGRGRACICGGIRLKSPAVAGMVPLPSVSRGSVMSYSLSQAALPVFEIALTGLSGVLDKAAAFATAKKLDPATLPSYRLAPD